MKPRKVANVILLVLCLFVQVFANYRDQMDLAKDPIFIQRVKMAAINTAITIQAEATNTPFHTQRAAFAKNCLNNPDECARVLAVGVANDAINFPASITRDGSGNILTINGATAGADAGIDGRLLNIWNAYCTP